MYRPLAEKPKGKDHSHEAFPRSQRRACNLRYAQRTTHEGNRQTTCSSRPICEPPAGPRRPPEQDDPDPPFSLALLAIAPGISASSAATGHLFWRISDPARPDAHLYALATVAFSQHDRLRFDPTVLRAFGSSRRLVLPNSAVLSKQNA